MAGAVLFGDPAGEMKLSPTGTVEPRGRASGDGREHTWEEPVDWVLFGIQWLHVLAGITWFGRC